MHIPIGRQALFQPLAKPAPRPHLPAMQTLANLVDATLADLNTLLASNDPSRIAVAWTGGKDSSVALFLWRSLLRSRGLGRARALNLDTGLKFPEIVALRDRLAEEWDIDLHIARPEVDLSSYPVARDKVACCNDLKIAPLHKALRGLGIAVLITGLRRDEHAARARMGFLEERLEPPHLRANPLAAWTEMDVWAFTLERGLPYCSLYDAGYRSLGCRPCTRLDLESERSGRDQDKEQRMEELRSLGYF